MASFGIEVKEAHRTKRTPGSQLDNIKFAVAAKLSSVTDVAEDMFIDALDQPKSAADGQLAFPVPRIRLPGNQQEHAKSIAGKLAHPGVIASASAAGTYINIKLDPILIVEPVLRDILAARETYGNSNIGEGKTVVVEFSSPNIAKPFHAGHLRSTIIGNFIRNVHRATGHKTIAINYLGDWGKQYGLLAVGFSRYGSEEKLEQDPIQHLFEVYVAINKAADEDPSIHDEARAYFKRMEDGDEEALALWTRFRSLSIEKYKAVYRRLNVEFDVYSGESMYGEGMVKALDLLGQKGLLQESDGAQVCDFKTENLGTCVVQKKDGTTLYITRDIAAAIGRQEEYKFDKMFYVVAAQQDLHFKQLFLILKKAGMEWASTLTHINFGMVTGMSTRKGTVVFLEQILEEAKETMHEVMKKNETKYAQIEDPDAVADIVGLSAVIIQDMQARRVKDYAFNWSRMTSFEGDTGPYLQYAHARLCSIERKTGLELNLDAVDFALLREPEAIELIMILAQYPDVIRSALASLEPCTIVHYLLKVCAIIAVAFEKLWVMGQAPEIAQARLAMYQAARLTVSNGLRLLGLTPLERM